LELAQFLPLEGLIHVKSLSWLTVQMSLNQSRDSAIIK